MLNSHMGLPGAVLDDSTDVEHFPSAEKVLLDGAGLEKRLLTRLPEIVT